MGEAVLGELSLMEAMTATDCTGPWDTGRPPGVKRTME